MRLRGIVLSSIVLLAGLAAFSNSTVLACGPAEFDAPSSDLWCEVRARTPTPPPTPIPIPVVAAAKPAAAIAQKSGDSPENAIEINDNEQTIDSGARKWYKIGSDGSHIDVWMLTYGAPGLGFVVYAPNQDIYAPDSKPKGVGTYPNSDPNTLRWAGGSFQQKGNWLALVTNSGSVRQTFKIGSNQSAVGKTCNSYWETLPTGQYVYWTACN